MSVVELAKLKESCVKGHHVYQADFVVGAGFSCERELRNPHSEWAIVVKKPESGEVVGHVPDDLARVLFPLITSGKIQSMTCEVTGRTRAAEGGVWVQGGGIVIPCTYILKGKKIDRPYVRCELKGSARKKRLREDDETGMKKEGKRLRQ